MTAIGRDNLYYIDIVKNNMPSEKINKITNKQINKIEPTNKIEPINKNNLLKQIKLWHQRMGHINPTSL